MRSSRKFIDVATVVLSGLLSDGRDPPRVAGILIAIAVGLERDEKEEHDEPDPGLRERLN
jgi:hypothetical protein